jgi:low affinity Fe/Cu permease
MRQWFSDLTRKVSDCAGSWQASLTAFVTIVAWLAGGLYFNFLDPDYQLLINTVTTVTTFLMVFLIQSSQNRDTKAIHLKLDDLILSIRKANDKLIDIEDATDDEIAEAKDRIGSDK